MIISTLTNFFKIERQEQPKVTPRKLKKQEGLLRNQAYSVVISSYGQNHLDNSERDLVTINHDVISYNQNLKFNKLIY